MNSDFCVAVHALVYLDHKNCCLSSEELADNICTNSARVRKVMSCLKKAGLIETHEGAEGGYIFAGKAAETSLEDVSAALGTRFVSSSWHSGDQDKPCLVSSGMADIMYGLMDDLNGRCLARLGEITIADISARIFG